MSFPGLIACVSWIAALTLLPTPGPTKETLLYLIGTIKQFLVTLQLSMAKYARVKVRVSPSRLSHVHVSNTFLVGDA